MSLPIQKLAGMMESFMAFFLFLQKDINEGITELL
jgi:hypothetical protein